MKQLLSRVTGAAAASMFFVQNAVAALNEPDTISGLSTETNFKTALKNIVEKVLDYVLIIAVIYVIVAGIRLIISGGEEGEKDKAKKTIIYVIIGIIVVLFARVIVMFVNTTVG
jgi:succinate dehydrogenase/fumarate reductase cytochrome b subunit